MNHVKFVPGNVYEGSVFLLDKSCEVCGQQGYDGAGVISICPSDYWNACWASRSPTRQPRRCGGT